MAEYIVTEKATGVECFRYEADAPTEWGFAFVTHDHKLAAAATAGGSTDSTSPDPARWRIWVGSFFDRFGSEKLAILSSTDPAVQAVIKDASVRRYIDLLERHDELAQVITLFNSKGFGVDASNVLDVMPSSDEVWNG